MNILTKKENIKILPLTNNKQYDIYIEKYNTYIIKTRQTVSFKTIKDFIYSYDQKSASTQRKVKTSLKQSLNNTTSNYKNLFLIDKEFNKIKTKTADTKILNNKVFTNKEITFLKSKSTQRQEIIIDLLYTTGLRISELINIKYTDIKCDDENCHARVLGKGKKERIVYLLQKQVNKAQYIFNSKIYLLETKNNNKYARTQINELLNGLGKRIGMTINPHKFRHSFATNTLISKGKSLKAVSNYLGHSTTGVTADMYIHDTLHPRDVLM